MRLTKTISKYKKSKSVKTLVANFFSLSLLKVASIVFPLITLPYLSRVIGVEKFGMIAYATAIMVFVETIVDWGFNYTATRDVAKNREDKQIVGQILSEVLAAKSALMLLSLIVLIIMVCLIPTLYEYRWLILFTFVYIPGHIFLPDWFFQAEEKMKYITFLSVISKAIFTILVFVMIRNEADYLYQPLLNACGYIVSGIIAMYLIVYKFGIKLYIPSRKSVMRRLRSSTDMFVSLLLPNLYTNFSTILLKSSCGASASGVYSAGQRFQNLGDQFTQLLSRTFFPFLARNHDKHYLYVRITGIISIVSCLMLYVCADWIIHIFYAPEFSDAAIVLKIFSISPFFLFLMNTYGPNYLVIMGKENILRNIIICCSILGFLCTCWFTTKYSYIGTALTITTIWGIRGALTWYYAIKVKQVK